MPVRSVRLMSVFFTTSPFQYFFFILEHFNIVNECALEAIKHGTCEAGLQTFSPMPVDVSTLFGGRVVVVV